MHAMRNRATIVACLLLAGCAQAPVMPPPADLFRDELFAPPSQRISAGEIFALSDAMQRYLDDELEVQFRTKGARQALLDSVTRGQLKIEYDSATTRTAAQAFDARAGNCLSLVIMTAAFAKALNLHVHYNVADGDLWSRAGNIYFLNAHVNVTLGRRLSDSRAYDSAALMTVDFLPPQEITWLRTQEVDEATIVAMFMNNRAAESLVGGRLDDAYWWARQGIRQDPAFMGTYNTLGVIYLRRAEPAMAERAFRRVLTREPANTRALANLALALGRLGREAEAAAVERELARIEHYAPFYFFHRGLAAMEAGDFPAARTLLAKEVARAPDYHEFHFWLGLVELRLGNVERARAEVALALENSTNQRDHDLYAAKLQRLSSLRR
jgi:tetratricopeptide (TPR) repeat protein